jgi:hypothetical protein
VVSEFEVEVAEGRNADGSPAIAIIVSSATAYLSLWLLPDEAVALLGKLEGADRVRRHTAGTAGEAKVHWSLFPGKSLFIRVGSDDEDETWNFGVTLGKEDSEILVHALKAECERAA